MRRQFTGRHMLAVLVGGFGIVIAVNFYMASVAVGGFSGVVVENSYVASQKFNTWLDESQAQDELGWSLELDRDGEGRLFATAKGVPAGAQVTATLRRPLGAHETRDLVFASQGDGRYISETAIPDGRWIARVSIASGDDAWVDEQRIE